LSVHVVKLIFDLNLEQKDMIHNNMLYFKSILLTNLAYAGKLFQRN